MILNDECGCFSEKMKHTLNKCKKKITAIINKEQLKSEIENDSE